MHKLTVKLVLASFVLMYSHQAFEHVGHFHGDDHACLSFDLTRNIHTQHEASHTPHVESCTDDHEHDMHQHFSEFHPKNIKPCRKTVDCLTVAYVKYASLDYGWDSISDKFPHDVGTQINSSIPQYLRAQSFLI